MTPTNLTECLQWLDEVQARGPRYLGRADQPAYQAWAKAAFPDRFAEWVAARVADFLRSHLQGEAIKAPAPTVGTPSMGTMSATGSIHQAEGKPLTVPGPANERRGLLHEMMVRGAIKSFGEGRRLVHSGAVSVNGEKAGAENLSDGYSYTLSAIRVGKRDFDAPVPEVSPAHTSPKICNWERSDANDPDDDCWDTDCGQAFVMNDGTPQENDLKFCCFCGGSIPTPTAPANGGKEAQP